MWSVVYEPTDLPCAPPRRHPDRAEHSDPKIQTVRADVRNPISVEAALVNAWGVVNAVSLYVEHGRDTFHAIHVNAARTIARSAREAGAERLIQVSGIGADTASPSLYVRKRAEGEHAVQSAFPGAVIVRPAVMFGTDGGFVTTVLDLMRKLPAYPMFGRGQTRLQPVAVDDVADAIARILHAPGTRADAVRVRRARGLHLRGFPSHRRARSGVATAAGPVPVRRLAPFGAHRGESSRDRR